ncbi:hypothetical protein EDC01DRAFT_634232 [Geopyxis carbonaria]|nr:hypothetical protein EDC01DRAFT_634232 [Geopyxis carbonaria]
MPSPAKKALIKQPSLPPYVYETKGVPSLAALSPLEKRAVFDGKFGLMTSGKRRPHSEGKGKGLASQPERPQSMATSEPISSPSPSPSSSQAPSAHRTTYRYGFLEALLNDDLLQEIMAFNHSAIELVGTRELVVQLRAIERDPEHVLLCLKKANVMNVLETFFVSWKEGKLPATKHALNQATQRPEPGPRSHGNMAFEDVGNLLGNNVGDGKAALHPPIDGSPGPIAFDDVGNLLSDSGLGDNRGSAELLDFVNPKNSPKFDKMYEDYKKKVLHETDGEPWGEDKENQGPADLEVTVEPKKSSRLMRFKNFFGDKSSVSEN